MKIIGAQRKINFHGIELVVSEGRQVKRYFFMSVVDFMFKVLRVSGAEKIEYSAIVASYCFYKKMNEEGCLPPMKCEYSMDRGKNLRVTVVVKVDKILETGE